MIKAIFFDAGGVLFLNKNGVAAVNEKIVSFIKMNQGRYILGILSSTNLPLNDIVASYKLDDYFDIIQTSGESKLKKDIPEFFAKAVKKVGVHPKEAVMVDNDADFIDAAKNAGLQTIYYSTDIDLVVCISNLV